MINRHLTNVKSLKKWIKIELFIFFIFFCISFIAIGNFDNIASTFFLNIAFLFNVITSLVIIKNEKVVSNPIFIVKLLLEIIFLSTVIHLTGGLSSNLIWLLLIPIISATHKFSTVGAIAVSTVICLVIIIYQLWINSYGNNSSGAEQILFFISYSSLFFISAWAMSFISFDQGITKRVKVIDKPENKEQENRNSQAATVIDISKYQEVVESAAELSRLDHDINNPLTIISLSISRILISGKRYNDDKLIKYANQMSNAITSINNILSRLDKLKKLDIIQEHKRKNDEKANPNS